MVTHDLSPSTSASGLACTDYEFNKFSKNCFVCGFKCYFHCFVYRSIIMSEYILLRGFKTKTALNCLLETTHFKGPKTSTWCKKA